MKTFFASLLGSVVGTGLVLVALFFCPVVKKHFHAACCCVECVCCPGCCDEGVCKCGDDCKCCPACKCKHKHHHHCKPNCCKPPVCPAPVMPPCPEVENGPCCPKDCCPKKK